MRDGDSGVSLDSRQASDIESDDAGSDVESGEGAPRRAKLSRAPSKTSIVSNVVNKLKTVSVLYLNRFFPIIFELS